MEPKYRRHMWILDYWRCGPSSGAGARMAQARPAAQATTTAKSKSPTQSKPTAQPKPTETEKQARAIKYE
ncbi:MAG: hypothetical protein Q9167_006793, partial [Letrouitia subvulpina]